MLKENTVTECFKHNLCLPDQFATFDISHSPVSELPVAVCLQAEVDSSIQHLEKLKRCSTADNSEAQLLHKQTATHYRKLSIGRSVLVCFHFTVLN